MSDKKNKSPYAVDVDTLYSRLSSERPTYAGTYDNHLTDLYGRITTRPDFVYDVTKDPTYQQYKGQYIQQGKLAMKDTMGQAAALTGGYGNSYGQQVGQQAYDAYLQKLGDVVPELYDRAYGRYQDENDKLLQQYAMLGDMRDNEYNRWRTDVSDWEAERAYQTQLEAEEYNRRTAAENTAYSRQQQAYSNLYALIGSTGYNPTDAELQAAGMTRQAANALINEYTRAITPTVTAGSSGGSSGGGGRSGGGSSQSGAPDWWNAMSDAERKAYQSSVGTAADGIWGPNTRAASLAADGLNGPGGGGGSTAGYTLGELLATQSGKDANGNNVSYSAEQILDSLAARGVPITDAVIEDVLWARGK